MKNKKQLKEQLFEKGLKQCPRCDEPKTFSEFAKDKNRQDGLQCWCKEHMKEDHEKNKAKRTKQQRWYYLKNREGILEKKKEYQDKNKEKIAKTKKEYREKLENKKKRNKRAKRRRKSDPHFQLRCNLAGRIRKVLKGNNKSLSTMFLIGCDIDYLMYHIQNQFTEGMSWDNYGEWHVDHIKPCAKFDMTEKSSQSRCFNFKNLQPLWALDNLRKGNKYSG